MVLSAGHWCERVELNKTSQKTQMKASDAIREKTSPKLKVCTASQSKTHPFQIQQC